MSLLLVLILGFFLVVAVAAGSGFWTGRIWERDRAAKEEADALELELMERRAVTLERRDLEPWPPLELAEVRELERQMFQGTSDVGQMRPQPETEVETTGAHDFGEWIANWQKINRQWESEGFPT